MTDGCTINNTKITCTGAFTMDGGSISGHDVNQVVTIEPGTGNQTLIYRLSPKAKLDCGSYEATMSINYDLQSATQDENTLILGENTTGKLEKSILFTVEKVPITLMYGYKDGEEPRSSHSKPDGSNEFYGKRPGATTPTGPADWSDRFSVASGLKYGQKDEDVYGDKYYKKPTVLNILAVGEGVLDDGYVLGDGQLYFTIAGGKPDENSASTNYYYGDMGEGYKSVVNGRVTCVHDSFGRSDEDNKLSY